MRNIKNGLWITIMLFILCTFPVLAEENAKVIMEKSKASVEVGKSVTLRAIARGKSKKIKWESSNSKIASINASGRVKLWV